ncbi:DNA (Cytosine-5)-methyltransferase DRM2 [Rhynchospora pubera]|uniref:DNA (cytosine-5-)-methyltransferase n=1 Tax=Rhynchospora pubera TaxID=906938 RepID=A0AAV8HJX3_9POAL|nr:DNA (Cytosine-5)-methyltransferase DRM2 [Rhynchospora pubera]
MSSNQNMVKLEETNSGLSPSKSNTMISVVPKAEPLDINPSTGSIQVKEEAGPSSSGSHLRSHFIEMGFSQALVDKVLQENGDGDTNCILETLFTYSALEKPGADSSSSLKGLFSSDDDDEEVQAPHGPTALENNLESKPSVITEKHSFLLSMNFSKQDVDLALHHLGEETSVEQLIDHILDAQTARRENHGENETKPSISGDVNLDEESNANHTYGVVEKTLHLLKMGFTEQEVSFAIETFGAHVSIKELTDSIFASRMEDSLLEVKDSKEFVFTGGANVKEETNFATSTSERSYQPSTASAGFYYENKNNEDRDRPNKRAKNVIIHKTGRDNPFNYLHSNNTFSLNKGISGARIEPGPPFFLYGSVLSVSQATWGELSQFLFCIEPEFVNSQSFSAVERKEGYIHNLPSDRRHHILPRPPRTIEGVLPFTGKWWPSWDPRKQFNGMIQKEIAGVRQLCEQLGRIARDSRGVPSHESQIKILDNCNTFNLIWVGENKLAPLEPSQLEQVMGYPVNHTNVLGGDLLGRMKAMTQCFHTDTIGYILSPLKDIYPDGIRVLSIFTGIGGAEVALHRLGIRFKCVVSVESSEINQKILKRWWSNTEQRGELRQFGEISKLTRQELEQLFKEFGGFDLVVGAPDATASGGRGSSALNGVVGIDSNLFFEFVRVVQHVKRMAKG